MQNYQPFVWVFVGAGGKFPSGVFQLRATAEDWIRKHRLSGSLTLYPVDTGTFDWAVEHGYFKPKNQTQQNAEFIARFSIASQEHYHYEDGVCDSR
ncbi:DUF7710 domain-containing protein [Bradyrhizobium paxllaeri]|uniref:DUF7710 domain-containing protein n=1 Tax=Bradyrhizobium paxllaeri TaxID=190148 RepID=UPI000810872A